MNTNAPGFFPAFWPDPVPPTEFCPPKFQKILPNFSLNFDYFSAQNCIRKLYFMLKTPKFANFAVRGIYIGLSRQFFQASPRLTPSSSGVPPIWLCPQRGPKIIPRKQVPHQKFCEKPCAPRVSIVWTWSWQRTKQEWCLWGRFSQRAAIWGGPH